MIIKEVVSLIKRPKDAPIKLVLIKVESEGLKGKKKDLIIKRYFKVLYKDCIFKGDLKRQLEFFFPENIKQNFPERDYSPYQKEGTSI